MLRYHNIQVVLQEVPGQITLCFSITGCPLRCKGCHSPFLWKNGSGNLLTDELFISLIDKYQSMISCILFMGGEWEEEDLIEKLKIAIDRGLNTCLYTGLDDVSDEIKKYLIWLKVGPWIEELGGLDSPKTNQKFINVETNEILNYYFNNKNSTL